MAKFRIPGVFGIPICFVGSTHQLCTLCNVANAAVATALNVVTSWALQTLPHVKLARKSIQFSFLFLAVCTERFPEIVSQGKIYLPVSPTGLCDRKQLIRKICRTSQVVDTKFAMGVQMARMTAGGRYVQSRSPQHLPNERVKRGDAKAFFGDGLRKTPCLHAETIGAPPRALVRDCRNIAVKKRGDKE